MQVILMLAGAIGLILGSVVVAALLCWLLWDAFRLVLHPEWTALAILTAVVLALAGKLPDSEFLKMVLAFAAVGGVPLWIAGRTWRRQRREGLKRPREPVVEPRASEPVTPVRAATSLRLYPAITTCICEDRSPTRDEVRLVASRLWREGLASRFGDKSAPPSFAARRVLLRAAIAALSGRRASADQATSRRKTHVRR